MKTQLVKVPQGFIVVSDEEITKHTKPCYCYNSIKNTWDDDIVLYQGGMPMYHYIGFKKIIAGIPDLSSIDFSLLSEEDCKRIGWVNVEKLLLDYFKDRYNFNNYWKPLIVSNPSLIEAFKTVQSLNDKMFSLKDILINFTCKQLNVEKDSIVYNKIKGDAKQYIQSLQQTSWDVEVEMEEGEEYLAGEVGGNEIWASYPSKPKIVNNSIKVLKII